MPNAGRSRNSYRACVPNVVEQSAKKFATNSLGQTDGQADRQTKARKFMLEIKSSA